MSCLLCSALAVLASGSGVSTERETFMDLVKTEITRLNGEVANRGSMSMVFHSGGVHVSAQIPWTQSAACLSVLCLFACTAAGSHVEHEYEGPAYTADTEAAAAKLDLSSCLN